MSDELNQQAVNNNDGERKGGYSGLVRGNEHSQSFPLSGRSGENVPASSQNSERTASRNTKNSGEASPSLNSGLCCEGRAQERAVRVDQTDCSNFGRRPVADRKGDVARESLDKASGSTKNPRQPMNQFPLSGKEPKGGFVDYPGNSQDNDD